MKYKLNKGFITEEEGKKVTIFNPDSSFIYTFNATGSFIYKKLQLGWDQEKIKKALVEKFAANVSDAEKDFNEFIADLKKNKIIT